MTRFKVLAVALASVTVLGFGAVAPSVSAACAVQAQIDAQNATIASLQAQLVGADARTALVLNAQIAARQAAVADLVASC